MKTPFSKLIQNQSMFLFSMSTLSTFKEFITIRPAVEKIHSDSTDVAGDY